MSTIKYGSRFILIEPRRLPKISPNPLPQSAMALGAPVATPDSGRLPSRFLAIVWPPTATTYSPYHCPTPPPSWAATKPPQEVLRRPKPALLCFARLCDGAIFRPFCLLPVAIHHSCHFPLPWATTTNPLLAPSHVYQHEKWDIKPFFDLEFY